MGHKRSKPRNLILNRRPNRIKNVIVFRSHYESDDDEIESCLGIGTSDYRLRQSDIQQAYQKFGTNMIGKIIDCNIDYNTDYNIDYNNDNDSDKVLVVYDGDNKIILSDSLDEDLDCGDYQIEIKTTSKYSTKYIIIRKPTLRQQYLKNKILLSKIEI